MFEKKILYDKYSDLRINKVHMWANQSGTSLFYDAELEHKVPYEEVVNAVVMGFIAIEKNGSVYSPSKYTLTDSGITFYCDDSITIAVKAEPFIVSPETDSFGSLFGKLASDLQANVAISGNVISGQLKYVSGYTGFSSKPAEQEGNYLALKVEGVKASDVVTVELIGGTVGHPITLDSDRNIVLKIADPAAQKVKVVVNGEETKTYKLTGLQLAVA